MTGTQFENIAFLWGWWTFFEAVWIAVLWWTRTRVLGDGVYRLPGVRRIRRGACERRVKALLNKLEQRGVRAEYRPDQKQLIDRWHRIVAGRCVSVVLQAVPLLITVLPYWWTTSLDRTTDTPFWMFAAVAGFGTVSLTLMAADVRATAVSDAAGVVTVEAIGFLELLLVPARRRAQDSALDVHGRQFGRLCNALRAQARHGTRTMPPTTRDRVRATTERLIVALDDANERYLLGEGADREGALRDLARLVAGALRQSCPPRAVRDSLMIVDPRLLAAVSESDQVGAAAEPLRTRMLAAVGRLAVAAGLVTGAFLVPGGEAVSGLLVAAGVSSVAAIWPHLREALHRGGLLVGDSSTAWEPDSAAEDPRRPAPSTSACCPHCSNRSSVTTESRTVG
ncbi:hypothetical protein [Streptomyces pactum]|uniref:hypothetical protein n=1 Tax=Streptomyces pactum TaxID=68249 RepID=UPI003702BBE7